MNAPNTERKFDHTDFFTMPTRVAGERKLREAAAARSLSYEIGFLDDCIRAILPHDLVLLGAPTGMGKTDLALAIAMSNAQVEGRQVAYFALEAEPLELERRTKFSWLSRKAYELNLPGKGSLNFTDWLLGKCNEVIDDHLDRQADNWMLSKLGGLRTFYRGQHFDANDLKNAIEVVHKTVDLIVIDHLHYVDAAEDEDESRALGETVKTIRDITLRIGKPILLVAHLRKRDPRARQIVPTIDDFHGSSNITKICTQVITIERANIEATKWWLSPTFMSVIKDRRAGATGLVALTQFDRRTRTYDEGYTLGRLIKGGTEWEQLNAGDRPGWANGHRQQELPL